MAVREQCLAHSRCSINEGSKKCESAGPELPSGVRVGTGGSEGPGVHSQRLPAWIPHSGREGHPHLGNLGMHDAAWSEGPLAPL